MNFIKKNKATIIVIAIFIVCVFLAMGVINFFFPEEGNAIYGNRTNGKESVRLSADIDDQLKDHLKEDAVKSVSVRDSGKIIEIIMTVNDDVPIETAKIYGGKALEVFKEEHKKYYDFQIFVKKDIEAVDFPIIGYKHKTKDSISWTKDRRSE